MTTTINHLDDTRLHAGPMDDTAPPDPEVPERSPGRRRFSAKYKAKILAKSESESESHITAGARRITNSVDVIDQRGTGQPPAEFTVMTHRNKSTRRVHRHPPDSTAVLAFCWL
jgi:hypothetical protein